MTDFRSIADIRRDYGELSLEDNKIPTDPVYQFQQWFEEVIKNEISDPTAMVLSTVDEKGHPDSRVVLLKGIEAGNFVFYTNYQSAKATQIKTHPYAALNFYWPHMSRQVRIRGAVTTTSAEQSDRYFASRPLKSQFSAIISPQSREVPDRDTLEKALNEMITQHQDVVVTRPDYWGGYLIIPDEIEFWQGRDNRLHDRIHYYRHEEQWRHHRLAP